MFLGLAIACAGLSSGGASIKKWMQTFLEKEAVLVFTFLEQLEYYDKPYNLLCLLENIAGNISQVRRASVARLACNQMRMVGLSTADFKNE